MASQRPTPTYALNKVLKKRRSNQPLQSTKPKRCIYAGCQRKNIRGTLRSHLTDVHRLSIEEVDGMGDLDTHPTITAHLICHIKSCHRNLFEFQHVRTPKAQYTKDHKDKEPSVSKDEAKAQVDYAVQKAKHIYAKPQSLSSDTQLTPLSSFDRNIRLSNNPLADNRRRARAALKQANPEAFAKMNAKQTKSHLKWIHRKRDLDHEEPEEQPEEQRLARLARVSQLELSA